jgi:hypothetical protein
LPRNQASICDAKFVLLSTAKNSILASK